MKTIYCLRNQAVLVFTVLIMNVPAMKLKAQEVYFQQEVNFTIRVRLDDQQHKLHAFQSVEYINNSPDSLTFIYFHLWPNAYDNNKTALARQLFRTEGRQLLFADPELRGYIDSLDFQSQGMRLIWKQLRDTVDICKVFLQKPLRPGDTVVITTPFCVKIPKGVTSRLGHIGQSYQISQWFPKPAVYDHSGWNEMPYLDQGEFYSEFGRYTVSITLPENYIVAASAELQNKNELNILNQLAADTAWKTTLNFGKIAFPPSSANLKTLLYHGNQIHDLAWFADKRYHVMKGKVVLPNSGREVAIQIITTEHQAHLWKNALDYASRAIGQFSVWIGDYPYKSFTVVQSSLTAGSGMEYPGLAVIGITQDAYSLDEVIAHEAVHNWFYSALGSNERMFPYMDESIASAYEIRYMQKYYPGKKLWEVYFKNKKMARFFNLHQMPVERMAELEWLKQARNNLEQPINSTTNDFSDNNYGTMVYNKGAIGFNYLRAYLGDSIFDLSMQTYYQQWKFRHPQPHNLREVFENNTDKDVDWFFNDFLSTTKRLDYKVLRIKNKQLLVKNKGEIASPLFLTGLVGNNVHAEKWVSGFAGKQWIDLPEGNFTAFCIDPMHITTDMYRLNNNIRTSGIFRKRDTVETQFYFTLESPGKQSIMYIPVVNWTRENGFMLGVALHNGFLLPKKIEYILMPFYAFRGPDIAGFGTVSYNIIPYESFIRMATISLDGVRFAATSNQNYHKARLGLTLHFRNKNPINPLIHTGFAYLIAASDLSEIELQQKAHMRTFLQLGYQLGKESMTDPFSLRFAYEYYSSFQKTSVEINYRYSYPIRNKGLDIRLFAGTMIKRNTETPFYNLAPGGRSGREQYLFEGSYPDRFSAFPNTFWSRQMTLSEGGLAMPVNDSLGFSNWLVSCTFTSSMPGWSSKLPIKPFITVLLNDHGMKNAHRASVFFESGVKTGIWGILEVYIPVFVSNNVESGKAILKDRIRFVFSLDAIRNGKLNTNILNGS